MTEDTRITKLEERVSNIEKDFWSKLERIDEKLTEIAVKIASQSHCPAPGSCIALQERIVRLENTHDGLAKTVADLIRWRAWLTGINLVVSTLSLGALTALLSYVVKNL